MKLKRIMNNPFVAYPLAALVLVAVAFLMVALLTGLFNGSDTMQSNESVDLNTDKTFAFSESVTEKYPYIRSVILYFTTDTLTIQCNADDDVTAVSGEDADVIRQKADEMLLQNKEFRDEFYAARKEAFTGADNMGAPLIEFYITGIDNSHAVEVSGETFYDPLTFYRAEKTGWERAWKVISND